MKKKNLKEGFCQVGDDVNSIYNYSTLMNNDPFKVRGGSYLSFFLRRLKSKFGPTHVM